MGVPSLLPAPPLKRGDVHASSDAQVSFRRPDGRLVLVALNCGAAEANFRVNVEGGAARGASVLVAKALPPHSIQTYVFPGRG